MKRNHLIVFITVLIISIACGHWITKTDRYNNYRELQFLESVVKNTLHQNGYAVELNSEYNILGYEMSVVGDGGFSQKSDDSVLYMTYLMKLNGKGVSPMTAELTQYIDLNSKINYMNINHGQWFKEISNGSLTIFQKIPKLFKKSKFQNSDDWIEIIDDREQNQIVELRLPLSRADFLTKQLISNVLNISNDINLDQLIQKAKSVNYRITINKQEQQITQMDVSYSNGIQELIRNLARDYPNLFLQLPSEEVEAMYFNLSVNLLNSNEIIQIPTEVKNKAISISDLK